MFAKNLLGLLRKLRNSMRASAVQIGTLIKAYLILLIQPLVNVLRIFDLDSDSSNGLPDNHADVCWHDAGSGILGLDDNSLAT